MTRALWAVWNGWRFQAPGSVGMPTTVAGVWRAAAAGGDRKGRGVQARITPSIPRYAVLRPPPTSVGTGRWSAPRRHPARASCICEPAEHALLAQRFGVQ